MDALTALYLNAANAPGNPAVDPALGGMARRAGPNPYVAQATALAPPGAAPVPAAPGVNPYVAQQTSLAPASISQFDPAGIQSESQSARALGSGFENFGSIAPALYGAGANLVSPGAGDSALDYAAGMQRRAQAEGPDIQSWNQVHNASDALAFTRNQALMSAPDMLLALGSGGLGGALVKGAARKAAMSAAEDYAARKVAETGVGALSEDVVAKQGVDAATRLAKAQAIESTTAQVAPRFLQAAADGVSPTAVSAATNVGAAAGMYPSVVASSVQGAPDADGNMVGGLQGQGRANTLKILAGDAVSAGLGAMLPASLLGQAAHGAAATAITDTAARIMPHIAAEAAKQGVVGAAAGVAQTAAQFATHKWVNDNVSLMSPTAVNAYINSAIGGGIMGAGLGAGIEGAHALPEALSRAGTPAPVDPNAPAAPPSWLNRTVSTFADLKDQALAKAKGAMAGSPKAAAGEPVNPDGTPMAPGAPAAAATPAEAAATPGAPVDVNAPDSAPNSIFSSVLSKLTNPAAQAAVKTAYGNVADSVTGVLRSIKSYGPALDAVTGDAQATAQVIKAHAGILGKLVDEPEPDAATTFQQHLSDLGDSDSTGLPDFDSEDAPPAIAPAPRAVNQNPYKLGSPMQDRLATFIPTRTADGPSMWSAPDILKPAMASVEKVLGFGDGGEPTAADYQRMDTLKSVAPDIVANWEKAAPALQQWHEGAKAATEAADNARPDNTAMADAMEKAQADAKDDLSPGPTALDPNDTVAHGMGDTDADGAARSGLREQMAAAKPGTPEHTALQKAYQDTITKSSAMFMENRGSAKDTPAERAAKQQQFTDRLAKPTTVEVDSAPIAPPPKVQAYIDRLPTPEAKQAALDKFNADPANQRRRLVQLDNMMSRHQSQHRALNADDLGPKDLLHGAMGDIALSGLKIKPESIVPGPLGKTSAAHGSMDLGEMTPAEAAAYRAQARNPNAKIPQGGVARLAALPKEHVLAAHAALKARALEGKTTIRDMAAKEGTTANGLVAREAVHQGRLADNAAEASRQAYAIVRDRADRSNMSIEDFAKSQKTSVKTLVDAESAKQHAQAMAKRMRTPANVAGEDAVDSEKPAGESERVTRQLPPTDSEGVPSQSGVFHVEPKSRYAEEVEQARKLYGQQGKDAQGNPVTIRKGVPDVNLPATPSQVTAARIKLRRELGRPPTAEEIDARIARRTTTREAFAKDAAREARLHEIGVKIGETELKKQFDNDPDMSVRSYGKALKELRDPATGKSKQYLADAANGKFDSAKVSEMRADNPQVTPRKGIDVEKADAHIDRLLGSKAGGGARKGGLIDKAELTDGEQKYVAKLRDSVQDVPETNRLRQAVDEFDAAKKLGTAPEPEHGAAAGGNMETAHEAARLAKAGKAERDARAAKGQTLKDEVHDPISDGLKAAAEDTDKHDYVAENKLLNETLKRMGIKDGVTVGALPKEAGKSVGGEYITGAAHIRISPNLKGAERIEVLAHELGHHILRSELARAMGVDLKSIRGMSLHDTFDAMATHAPELHAAINKDFQAWSEQHSGSSDERYISALASRKAFHRAANIRARGTRDASTLRDKTLEIGDKSAIDLHSFEEYTADQIARALTHTDSSPVGRFFKSVADKLKLAYNTLFKGRGGEKYAPAPSVEKWVQSLFDRTTNDVSEALKEPVPAAQAKTAVEAAAHVEAEGALPPSEPPADGRPAPPDPAPQGMRALVKFMRDRLLPDERRIIERVVNKPAVVRALKAIYKDRPGALTAMLDARHGMEARAAYAYLADRAGLLNTGAAGRNVLHSLTDSMKGVLGVAGDGSYARRIFNDIANGRIESVRAAGKDYSVRQREAAYRGAAQQIVDHANTVYQAAAQPLARAFVSNAHRMRDSGVPAIARIGAALQLHSGEHGGASGGLINSVTHNTDVFARGYSSILSKLDPREQKHLLNALQQRSDVSATNNPKVDAAIKEWRGLADRLHTYANQAGYKIGAQEKYAPVIMDIDTAAKKQQLVGLMKRVLQNPDAEAAVRATMSEKGAPSTKPIEKLIYRMADLAEQRSPANNIAPEAGKPQKFAGANKRLMQFVYDHGSPADIKEFASLQTKNPALLLSHYVMPLVKTAESIRRFGVNDVRLNKMLSDAKKQGATDAQIQQARDAVSAARGQIGLDGSPVLRKLLGAGIEGKITGPRTRAGIAALQTYENARLLPLTLLSSIVDPMGIAVRTGGDFKTSWDGFKFGMKALVNKQTKAEAHAMLQTLGSADDFFTNEMLTSRLGGGGEGLSRKVNDTIFKLNGMSSWVRATRYMALQAAHGFLAKHGAGANPTSVRYLTELGMRPGDATPVGGNRVGVLSDAERAAASPAELARDDRVRQGLLRFVDESILRPTSQQTPGWFSDPYMGLVTQYKTFAYAIHDQITGRILHELKHGNAKVLLPAMGYVPITIAAEMLRGLIQFGPGGNPQRQGWGPEDYAAFGAMRSGLPGPMVQYQSDAAQDAKWGRFYGSSLLGPAAQQAGEVLSTASGQRSVGKTLENAAPASAAWKNWDNGPSSTQSSYSGGMHRRAA